MNNDRKAAILINDLDTIVHLIEDMPAAPEYTNAMQSVQAARAQIAEGRARLHKEETAKRYDI